SGRSVPLARRSSMRSRIALVALSLNPLLLVAQGTRPITNGGLPSVSPDGKRIAFLSNADGTDDVYVINVDGTGRAQVTHTPAYEGAPSWSADGNVLFSVGRDTAHLYSISPSGTAGAHPRELAQVVGSGPVLSPDGRWIAYSAGKMPATKLVVSALDGS